MEHIADRLYTSRLHTALSSSAGSSSSSSVSSAAQTGTSGTSATASTSGNKQYGGHHHNHHSQHNQHVGGGGGHSSASAATATATATATSPSSNAGQYLIQLPHNSGSASTATGNGHVSMFDMASNAAVAAIGSSPDNHIPPLKRHMRAVIARLLDAEVNVHAYWQKRLRHPLLDWYFLHTAALGNHIFFLLISPTLFFCGFGHLARLLVYVIMTTVWMSGIAKDYICMPRPKSPPIARLTKVSSHSQEYGFPSSHTTYAVAVSSTLTTALNLANNAGYISDAQWTAGAMCLALFWTTISFGRLYCGMHSMTDVGGGAFMGVIIWYFWDRMFASVDSLSIVTGSWLSISLVALAVIGLLLMHPIPDNLCPCYEDSFCATGAMLGTFLGTVMYSSMRLRLETAEMISVNPKLASTPVEELYGYVFDEMDHPTDIATVPFSYEELGFVLTVVRIVFGLALVVLWRAAAKAALTPLFRAAYRVVGRWIGREKEVERLIHIKHCKHTANDSAQNGNGKAAAAETAATAASDVSTPTELMYSVANLVRIPVYMGIGVIATFGAPVMFEIVGLGLS